MKRFVVVDFRKRTKLTLTAEHSEKITRTVTIQLSGKRVVELSDKLCTRYADALAAYVKGGALIPLDPAAPAPAPTVEPDPLLSNDVHGDELDEDPEQDDEE